MIIEIERDGKYQRSEAVVFKEVDHEIIIVPTHRGVSSKEDALFTLADTGRLIWSLLDGTNTVEQVIHHVVEQYDVPEDQAAEDVVAFLEELAAKCLIK